MLKLEKIIQLLLLAMLTQTGLLLMFHPMPHRLVFSQANLLFMVGLLGLLFCCAFYFSRELQEIKGSLRQSSNYRHLLFLYFLMILVNAAGVLLLCGKEAQSGQAVEQMLTESFLSSSLLLLGIDIAVLSPAAPKFIDSDSSLRYRKSWGIALLFPCEKSSGNSVFSLLSSFGTSLCPSPQALFSAFGAVYAGPYSPKYDYSQSFTLLFLESVLSNRRIMVKW